MKHRPKNWHWQAEMRTHWRKWGLRWRNWHLARKLTTNPLFNMSDIETDGSPPVLMCVSYTAVLVWSVWRDAMSTSTMHSSRQIFATEKPWPQLSWLQEIRHNLANSLSDKSAGYEWFEATSDWCMGWSGTKHYWRYQRPLAQTSPWLHSIQRIFWIFTVTQISHNVRGNKLN